MTKNGIETRKNGNCDQNEQMPEEEKLVHLDDERSPSKTSQLSG